MNFYHELITEKSWQELLSLRRQINFVLIGGWAVYLYARTLKSKDIDIIVDYNQLPFLAKNYHLQKNDRLKKYEAVRGEVEIDIYLPHYSKLGLPIVDLQKQTRIVDGLTAISPEYLLVLKITTLSERARSQKGRKDFLDILSLFLSQQVEGKMVAKILRDYKLEAAKGLFSAMLDESTRVPELNLNPHRYSRLKKEIRSSL